MDINNNDVNAQMIEQQRRQRAVRLNPNILPTARLIFRLTPTQIAELRANNTKSTN